MFGTKKCPNCNMKIRVKNEALLTCRYCDARLSVLKNKTLVIQNSRPQGDHNNSKINVKAEDVNRPNIRLDYRPQNPSGLAGSKHHDAARRHGANPENRRQLGVMLKGLGIVLSLSLLANTAFPLLSGPKNETPDEFIKDIGDYSSVEDYSDFDRFQGALEKEYESPENSTSPDEMANPDETANPDGENTDVPTFLQTGLMIDFVEHAFQSTVEDIPASDFERITALHFRNPALPDASAEVQTTIHSIDYTLDNQELTFYYSPYLSKFRVSDYKNLVMFPNLVELSIADPELTDIDFIQALPKLEILDISASTIEHLEVVNEHPTLRTLFYSGAADIEFRDNLKVIHRDPDH